MFIRKSVHTAAMAKLAKANVDLVAGHREQLDTVVRLSQSRERRLSSDLAEASAEATGLRTRAANLTDEIGELRARLAKVVAQETPTANATVKRMARIARGEDLAPQSAA